MTRRVCAAVTILVLAFAGSAMAQSRGQVTVFGGYTLSDGVTGASVKAGDGQIYNAVDVKDSFNWGFQFGVNATENLEIGFQFDQQRSQLNINGPATSRDVGSMSVNGYHPYVAFNFFTSDAKIRPFVMVGLGATNYGAVSFTRTGGSAASTNGETQLSGTVGGGVKIVATPRVGLHVGVQWTPTYIKSNATGWWCDPYWGCYVVGSAQYANQFAFNGGVTVRF